MANWTDQSSPTDNIITLTVWRQLIDDLRVINDFLGNTDGGHASFTAGGVLLGNGQGTFQATSLPAKGSLLAGDGVTDPVELAIGTDDFVLRGDTASAGGVKWESPNWDVAEAIIYAYN